MRSAAGKIQFFMVIAVFALVLAVLYGTETHVDAKGAISLSTQKKTMYVGNSLKLILKNAENADVVWRSSDTNVVSIDDYDENTAVLLAKKKGNATVKAKLDGKTYKCKITVKKQSFSATSLIVDRGEIETLAFRGKKSGTKSKVVKWSKISSKAKTDKKVYWAVKNPSVISVSRKNNSTVKIKVKKAGSTVIRAKYKGKEYQCKITTKDPKLAYTTRSIDVKKSRTLSFQGKRSSTTSTIVKWNNLTGKPNTSRTIYWAVQNTDIATIKKKNASTISITGDRVGTTYIRAKYRGKLYQCKIKVTIPACWNAELEKSINTVSAIEQSHSSLSKFVYVTDSHWDSNAKRSPSLINYLTKKLDIPFTVFGGDAITSHHSTQTAAIAELQDFYAQFDGNVLSTTGNHDWNSEANLDVLSYLSEDQLFDLMYDKQTTFAVTENNGKCAYVDDYKNKVRYISFYFDTRLNIEPYVSWWVDEHITELPEGWTVMLFSHAYYRASRLGAAENMIPGAEDFANHILELQRDVNADVAAWMVGHCHRDLSTKLTYQEQTTEETVSEEDVVAETEEKENPTLLIVSTNCDTYKQSTPWGGAVMTLNTDKEQAFEIAQLDTENHKLYLTRVGAGRDRVLDY
ncbi:MAG: metallophosphoesterase [Eubacteriales bacterium]|nr:metallophosphoesterase [Eubacteriales bacterium]